MKKKTIFLNFILSLLVLSFSATAIFGQNHSANIPLRSLTDEVIEKWERLGFGGVELSDNGNWLIYPVNRNNGEDELRLHNLQNNSEKIIKYGENPVFSSDGKWLGVTVTPDVKTQKTLREQKKPVKNSFELLNLADGKTTRLKDISAFSFSRDGKYLILKPYGDEKSTSKSFHIIVRNLSSGMDSVFGSVKEYEWSDRGSLLAMIIDTEDKIGNGIKLFDGKSAVTLDSREADYSRLTWREDSNDLAAFRSLKTEGFKEETNDILIWKNISAAAPAGKEFRPSGTNNFPKNMRITEKSPLRWASDGNSVFFNIDTRQKLPDQTETKKEEKKEEKDEPEIPALEIWNSRDIRTIPEQKNRANDDSFLSVWHLDTNKFVQLGSKETRSVRFQPDSDILLAFDDTPYKFKQMFGRPGDDVYSVDIKTGARKKLLENVIFINDVSPAGQKFVYIKNDHYHLYDLSGGKDTNITENLKDSFVNLDDDHPVEQKFPYGFAGWDKTGSYFLVHSKFDIWKFDAQTGKGIRLTEGETGQTMHRLVRVDRSQRYIDLNEPVYVRRFGKLNKKSGYAKLVNGNNLQDIYWGDALVARLTVAKNKDVAAFSIEKYDDSPDLFVSQNGSSKIRQVSKTNPFENQFKPGKTELIEYVNHQGKKLQGILHYPDNYVAGRKYPMITYIYELQSDRFHGYSVPSLENYYSSRIFTNGGYFVLRPDIVFDVGDPGVSSTKTIELAVKSVVDKGLVDPARVGLVGHSWGGYQTAFAVTRTNIFAAAVAGAGITNLISMYGSITPSFGNTFESGHFEVSQERMQVPPWEDLDGYLRNSAIPNIRKMQTPLLLEVGDADTNVNWRQSIEMYNAARREKKEVVMLVYAKEGHGLRQKENRMDYQKRILEWFDHYLKGVQAKRWIRDNISYPEQQELLKKRELE